MSDHYNQVQKAQTGHLILFNTKVVWDLKPSSIRYPEDKNLEKYPLFFNPSQKLSRAVNPQNA